MHVFLGPNTLCEDQDKKDPWMAANRSTGHQKRVVFTQSWRSHVIAS
jgi:hypothetical protein